LYYTINWDLGLGSNIGGKVIADSRDRAAKLVTKKLGGRYNPQTNPDVKAKDGRAEVKSSANEIPEALQQLAGGTGPTFVVLPKPQHKKV